MSRPRDHIKTIYSSAITAVDPGRAIYNHIKREGNKLVLLKNDKQIKSYNLKSYKKIYIIGAGKATAAMALALEDLLGETIDSGTVCVKYGYTQNLKYISTIEAAHPVPDKQGLEAAAKIHSTAQKATGNDLIISLISGGGSSLLPLPPDNITLEEKKATTDLLLRSGASIHEINCVRKHLSKIKGGNLALAAYPATVINLMISDVVGDNMDVIASGPFVPDRSTFEEALDVLKKYDLIEHIPGAVEKHLISGSRGGVPENPMSGNNCFKNTTNLIIASNIIALEAAHKSACELGYNSLILSSTIEGDTAETSKWHVAIAREILETSHPVPVPACIISGGETTVQVTGNGLGGRNMEFCLQAVRALALLPGTVIASIGTDGTDGPTDSAGAVIDSETFSRAEKKGLDIKNYIYNNDSYNFFKVLNDLVVTGPTNTNVMDIRIVLVSNTGNPVKTI